jgi:hypothetical protein
MRKSIVLLTFAATLSALAAGCMPNGEGPLAEFSPRPSLLTDITPPQVIQVSQSTAAIPAARPEPHAE